MSERDPRVNPVQGDVLRKRTVLREVIGFIRGARGQECVNCLDGGWIKSPRSKRPSLRQFRKWAAGAYIVREVHTAGTTTLRLFIGLGSASLLPAGIAV